MDAIDIDPRAHAATVYARSGDAVQILEQLARNLDTAAEPLGEPLLWSLVNQYRGGPITVGRCGADFSTWRVVREQSAMLWLKHASVDTQAKSRCVGERIADVSGVTGFHWRSFARCCVVQYDSRQIGRTELLAKLDESVLSASTARTKATEAAASPTVGGLRRAAYLGLAGVSFGLAALGVIVPGLPTVPFLLLTSYFLVGSSPRLNERLLRSRMFGPLIRDWHEHRGIRPRVKIVSVAVMILVVTASVVWGGLSPLILVVVLVLAALGVAMLLRIPTIADDGPSRVRGVFPALGNLARSG